MEVFLSPIAEKKIMLLLNYLENEWSLKSKEDFLSKLLSSFHQIAEYPESCARSKHFPGLYKCVVTRQTSFYYRIKKGKIEIITLIDNRQDPGRIKEEINQYP